MAPGGNVLHRIGIISMILEEGHPRVICAKLCFKSEKYFCTRRFLNVYYTQIRKTSPTPLAAIFLNLKKLNNLGTWSPKEYLCKIIFPLSDAAATKAPHGIKYFKQLGKRTT